MRVTLLRACNLTNDGNMLGDGGSLLAPCGGCQRRGARGASTPLALVTPAGGALGKGEGDVSCNMVAIFWDLYFFEVQGRVWVVNHERW